MELIIVDCQNDFIDGSMACQNAKETVEKIIASFKEGMKVYYTSDFHPINHLSFTAQGGPWPAHCVEGTYGAEIADAFHDSMYPPTNENTFFKGRHYMTEEYSGFSARNGYDEKLEDLVGDEVFICGIASEYCVRETALAFLKAGKKVIVLKDLLAYVNKEDHEKNLKDLEEKGIEIQ